MAGENLTQKMVAFEKEYDGEMCTSQIDETDQETTGTLNYIGQKTINHSVTESVLFIPGNVCNTIPEYLIENPETKIILLNIDLNEYESTITALEFLYPRIVRNGILIFDNYKKNHSEINAINDYFAPVKVIASAVSGTKRCHYIVKE